MKAASSVMKSVAPSRRLNALERVGELRARARATRARRGRSAAAGAAGRSAVRDAGARPRAARASKSSCRFQRLASQPLALPRGVVRVLHGQLGERRASPRREGAVERRPARARGRPSTSRRRRCGASSAAARALRPRGAAGRGAQQRARRQVERAPRLFARAAASPRASRSAPDSPLRSTHAQRRAWRGLDDLRGLAVDRRRSVVRRISWRRTTLVERPLERRDVERPVSRSAAGRL